MELSVKLASKMLTGTKINLTIGEMIVAVVSTRIDVQGVMIAVMNIDAPTVVTGDIAYLIVEKG